MSITQMKCLNKTFVDQLKKLEKESCNHNEISLKLELDYKLTGKQSELKNNEFFYFEADQLIGYLGILEFGKTAELTGMVHPEFRRRGIFTKLFHAAIEEIRSRQYHEVLLLTDEKSLSGKKFIEDLGGIYKNSEYEMTFTSHALSSRSLLTFTKAKATDLETIIAMDEVCFGNSHSAEIETTYVAYSDETIVGKVRLELINKEGGIYGLGVSPEFRNRGYGKSLLENSIFKLKEQGAERIFLQVVTMNKRALGLYLKTGFITNNRMDYYTIVIT